LSATLCSNRHRYPHDLRSIMGDHAGNTILNMQGSPARVLSNPLALEKKQAFKIFCASKGIFQTERDSTIPSTLVQCFGCQLLADI
jgi:hypothetical protein